MTVDIRQAEHAERGAIQAFVDLAYGPMARFKDARRWDWQFVSNPFNPDRGRRASVWNAWDGDRVVGQIAVQHGRCAFGGEVRDFGWIVDVMVLESHRGQRLGHRLYDAIAERVPTTLTLTMALATRRIAERQRAITLPPVHCMFLARRCDPAFVRRFVAAKAADSPRWRRPDWMVRRVPLLAGALAASAGFAGRLRGCGAPTTNADPGSQITEIARFDASIDSLSDELTARHDIVCARDAAFLNWRFADAPHLRYRRFVMHHRNLPVGLLVTREPEPEELPIGTVCELTMRPGHEHGADALLSHALRVLDPGLAGIVAGASAPALIAVLSRHGFITTKKHHPTVVTTDQAVRRCCSGPALRCFFTKGDHDWDQVHPA